MSEPKKPNKSKPSVGGIRNTPNAAGSATPLYLKIERKSYGGKTPKGPVSEATVNGRGMPSGTGISTTKGKKEKTGEMVESAFELGLPKKAQGALKNAYVNALKNGHTVLIVEADMLVQVAPNNERTVVGKVAPYVAIPKGTTFEPK